MITYKAIEIDDIKNVWSFIEALKLEGVEVSFTEIDNINVISAWVNSALDMVYLAYDQQELLGIVKGHRDNLEEKKHSVFLTAAILPSARGNSIAKYLTEFALNEMKKREVLIARIYVYSDNLASLNAVKKLEFEFSGLVKMHHKCSVTNQFIDDHIFHKIL